MLDDLDESRSPTRLRHGENAGAVEPNGRLAFEQRRRGQGDQEAELLTRQVLEEDRGVVR